MLFAGGDFGALVGLDADGVVLRLQQQFALVGDVAHGAALREQAQVAACVDDYLFTGADLLVLLGDAVDMGACRHHDAGGGGGGDAGWRA
ncbi:hypothetical protein D3C72_1872370 [compost metagenome]